MRAAGTEEEEIEEEEEEKVGITKVIPAAEKAHETPAYEKRDSS